MNLNFIKIFIISALGLYSSLAAANTYYIDGDFGDDTWNGSSDVPGAPNGPKKSINAALKIPGLIDGDILIITGGAYNDRIVVKKRLIFNLVDNISIKSLTMNGLGIKVSLLGGREMVVSDTLNLIQGNVDASVVNCNLVAGPSCKILGGSRGSFVEGRLYRVNTLTSVSDLYFPMGTVGDFRPVYMTFNQSSSSSNRYIAQVFQLPAPPGGMAGGIKFISRVHYWNVRYTGPAAPSAFQFRVFYDSGKLDDEIFDPGKLRLAILQPSQSNYKNLGGVGTAPRKGFITGTVKTDTMGILAFGNAFGGTNTLGLKIPLAKFAYQGQCVNSPVQFRDSSFSHKSNITRRFWDFGTGKPGDTSNLLQPKFTFTSVGPFTVSLRVWNNLGFDDTFKMQMSLKNGPKSYFPNGDGCFGQIINFQDSTKIDPPDTVKTRKWDLGDGNFPTTKTFAHKYGFPGKYTVKLITTSNSGCVDTFKKDIVINKKPSPNFTTTKVCFDEFTKLTGTGGNLGDTISSWKWIVDGNFEAMGKELVKQFPTAKLYNIELAVVSQTGCLDTVKKPVTIFRKPTARFYLDPSVPGNDSLQCYTGNNFKMKDVSITYQGQVLTPVYKWGTPPASSGNAFTMSSSGAFPVKLIVTSDKGCIDSVEQTYKVFDPIKIKFSVYTYCLPKAADFKDSSSAGSATITNVSWNFGNSYTGSGSNTNHTYSFGGFYDVWDIITTSDGCKDSLKQQIEITNKPTINLSTGANNPFCTYDSLQANVLGGKYVKWNNGDTNRLRYLKVAGVYKVTAYTSPFCFVTDSVTAKVLPPVFPDAGPDTSLVKGRYIILKGDGGVKYQWTPKTLAETPDSVRTRVRPLVTQMYYLKVTDGNNCVGVDSVLVKVIEPLYIRIPNMITPNGDGKNDAWDLREVPNVENGKVSIYNSLGGLVYEKNGGYDHTWNGVSQSGTNLPVGNYMYVIEIPTEKEPFKGYLHIAR